MCLKFCVDPLIHLQEALTATEKSDVEQCTRLMVKADLGVNGADAENMQQQLINFLKGSGVDDCGRKITEIIGWSDGQLESCHDYIQWVFPNRSHSHFNPGAPILDDETEDALMQSPAAIGNVLRMLLRMYSFYSFELVKFDDGTYQLNLPSNGQKPWWVTPRNHNFLRLTRILNTLKSLDCQEDLFALSDILDVTGRKYRMFIGERALRYWRDAFGSD